ncbi:MAG: exodeoxyribonuclease VII large subunit, partial [Stackebrandtia sp.]
PCLAQPERLITDRQAEIDTARERARRAFVSRLDTAHRDVAGLRSQLRALSPQGTLDRGYAIVRRADGAVVRADTEVTASESLRVKLARGELTVTVKESP